MALGNQRNKEPRKPNVTKRYRTNEPMSMIRVTTIPLFKMRVAQEGTLNSMGSGRHHTVTWTKIIIINKTCTTDNTTGNI